MPPSFGDVADYAKSHALPIDAAEFFDYYESNGWTTRGVPVCNWKALMRNWVRRQARWAREKAELEAKEARDIARLERRVDEREAKRTAHIDAKIEEREAKRQAQPSRKGRKADNWIPPTENERKEFSYDD